MLQGSLVGARDAALKNGSPSGIRLLPDPNLITYDPATGMVKTDAPLAFNRIVPLDIPPDYKDGSISIYPATAYSPAIRTVNGYAGCPCLVVEESVIDSNGLPQVPTSWFWNIRIGEKIRINNSGKWYTIVGPMLMPNPEQFVNVGPPGTASPLQRGQTRPEYLLLVNGLDDNQNGWTDEGFDGVDNNGNGLIDELAEWEQEVW